jgi:hypothetical protein
MNNIESEKSGDNDPTWEGIIRVVFLTALDALKLCEPLTPEWDFYWEMLSHCRIYIEGKARKNES